MIGNFYGERVKIMKQNVTSEKLEALGARLAEIFKRSCNGGLDIDVTLPTLQAILDGVHPPMAIQNLPEWYESPEEQVQTATRYLEENGNEPGFTAADIPAIPTDFTPRTPTEVLMLVVTLPDKGKVKLTQRNFDALWNFIVPPEGFSKWRWSELISNTKFLRYIKGICKKPGMRWVGFDPEVYIGLSPDQALAQAAIDGITLASDEVLMAAALFKKWAICWDGKKWHYPNMSTYQFKWGAGWRRAPYLYRWFGVRQLELGANDSDIANDLWSSPAVREL